MKGKINLLIPLAFIITVSSCHPTKKVSEFRPKSIDLHDPYSGDWDFVIQEMPSGDAEGILHIKKEGFGYRASVSGDIGDMAIDQVSIEDERMKGSFQYKGFKVNVKGNFAGDTFAGKIGVTLVNYPFKAKKRSLAWSDRTP